MIWVIGANGMLGKELCLQLEQNNLRFIATGKETDITDFQKLDNFLNASETTNYLKSHKDGFEDFDNGKIKWIINCAAYTDVRKAETEQELCENVNVKGALNAARVARAHGAKLIHISTDYVFDGYKNSPYTEKDQKNPVNVYGKSKSSGEDAVISAMSQYYILRTSSLYGFEGKNFVYTIAKSLNQTDELKIIKDQKMSPTCTTELAEIIVTIIKKSYKATSFFGKNSALSFGIYNVSGKGETSWFDFARKISEIMKKAGKLSKDCKISSCTADEIEDKTPRPGYSVLDCSKIEKELGVKIPDWEKSLEKFIKNKRFNP